MRQDPNHPSPVRFLAWGTLGVCLGLAAQTPRRRPARTLVDWGASEDVHAGRHRAAPADAGAGDPPDPKETPGSLTQGQETERKRRRASAEDVPPCAKRSRGPGGAVVPRVAGPNAGDDQEPPPLPPAPPPPAFDVFERGDAAFEPHARASVLQLVHGADEASDCATAAKLLCTHVVPRTRLAWPRGLLEDRGRRALPQAAPRPLDSEPSRRPRGSLPQDDEVTAQRRASAARCCDGRGRDALQDRVDVGLVRDVVAGAGFVVVRGLLAFPAGAAHPF